MQKSIWLLISMVALLMLALGAAAGASTDQDGPTPPELGDPVAGTNEVQSIAIDGTAGTFTLSFDTTGPTGALAYNIDAADMETALEVLGDITDVVVSGGTFGNPYLVRFLNPGYDNVPLMTADDALLTGGVTGTVTIVEERPGALPPATTPVVPHGAYSASTNFCLQCHDVHNAPGAYALMAKASVTATCATCHTISGETAPSQPAGGPGDNTIGTVSLRTAYDVGSPLESHSIGFDTAIPGGGGAVATQSDWDYGAWKGYVSDPPHLEFPGGDDAGTAAGQGTADATGGMYCASCHTPHGEYGQMVNNWTSSDEGNGVDSASLIMYDFGSGWQNAWLDLDGGAWYVCPLVTDPDPGDPGLGPNCVPAQVQDAEDQTVSLYGYKLLSAYPNHTYSIPQTYMVDEYNHDGAGWCTACHTANSLTGGNHNHDTGCSACHGNPSNDGASNDFPHTSSVDKFLIDYPDALCINCHTPGSLP